MVAADVSSRYSRRRSAAEYRKVGGLYPERSLEARPGNYMVFFPSYQYMGTIEEIRGGRAFEGGIHCCVQGHADGRSRNGRNSWRNLTGSRSESLAAFCVMGGRVLARASI